MCYSVMIQAYSEKEIPSSPNRSRTYDHPITSSDALSLSYRRHFGNPKFTVAFNVHEVKEFKNTYHNKKFSSHSIPSRIQVRVTNSDLKNGRHFNLNFSSSFRNNRDCHRSCVFGRHHNNTNQGKFAISGDRTEILASPDV